MKKLWIIGLIIVATFGNEISAQLRTYSNEFLSLGVGARGLAMGNTQSAFVNDVTAAYWNPAGLQGIENTQLGLMHAEWFAGVGKYDYLGMAMPIMDNNRTAGITLIRFGVDDIPNTLFIIDPDGSVNYDNLTTFSAADYAVLLSYAQKWKKFNIGGNVKIVHRRVGSFANSWGFGIDVGAQYKMNDDLSFGLSIKDLTTTFNAWSFNFTPEEQQALAATDNVIPVSSVELTGQRIILGGAYNFTFSDQLSLLTALDLDITIDGKRNTLIKSDPISIDPHMGLELNYKDLVFVRAGLNNIQQIKDEIDPDQNNLSIQPNAGVGFKVKQISIDYAFTGLNNVNAGTFSHVFSLIIDFKKKQIAYSE